MGRLRAPVARVPSLAAAVLLGLAPAVVVLAWSGWLEVLLDSLGPTQQEKLVALDRQTPHVLPPTGARLIARPLPPPEVAGTSAPPEMAGTSEGTRGDRSRNASLESRLLTLRLDPTNAEKLKAAERALVAELERLGEAGDAGHRAGLLSDLAAVRFGRAAGGGPPLHFFAALSAAEEAHCLAPGLPEASFNRALLLEALHLPIQAEEAWRGFFSLYRRPAWADEAQAPAERLALLPVRQGTRGALVPKASRVAFASSQAAFLGDRLEKLRKRTSPREPDIRAFLAEACASGLPDLAASAAKLLAYRTSLDGRFRPALDLYADAQRRYEKLGDEGKAAVIRVMRAEIFDALGQSEEALAEVVAALAVAPRIADPWDRYSLYWVAGNTVAVAAPPAAIPLWREASEACREMPKRPFCPVDGRIRLARRLSDPAAAAGEIEQAEQALRLLPDSLEKKRTELDVAIAKAEGLLGRRAQSQADLEAAVQLYGRAIEGLEALGSPATVAEARLARAVGLTRLGLAPEARAELEAGLVSVRQWDQDQRFRPEAAEIGAPGALREIFERLIPLHLAEGGEAATYVAFLLSEEMRDRLAPRMSRQFAPFTRRELERALTDIPIGTAIIEYTLVSSSATGTPMAAAWVLSPGSLRLENLPVGPGLDVALQAVRRAADHEDLELWKSATGELWNNLVSPAIASLPTETHRLVIIPDSEIYGVPFRGLWCPSTARYLDEDFEISLAPSVRSLFTPEEAAAANDAVMPVLSVGFEDFSALGLDALPRAVEEREAVARVYGLALHVGCEVTDWPSLRRCLPRAEVVHLATHAAADSRQDGWSWLALPEETVGLEQLWRELPALPNTRLVVLAACESATTASGGEGLGGLARPFLARGAGAVVGTLWPIKDTDSAAMFPLLHEAYWESGEVGAALSKAREGLGGWRERPWGWGGVTAIGTAELRRED